MLAVDGCLCLSMSPPLCAQDTPTLSSPPRSRQCCRSAPQPASTGSCCCGTTRRSPSGRLAATQRWAPGQTASLACHQAAAQLSGGVRPGGGQARLSSQRAHRLDRVPGWRRPRMGRQIRCCIDTLCAGLTQSGGMHARTPHACRRLSSNVDRTPARHPRPGSQRGWLVCRDWLGRCNCTRVCPCRYASEVRREGVRSLLVTETLVMEEAIRRRRPAPWHVW